MIASPALCNTKPGIIPLPRLCAMAHARVDQSFFEVNGFPHSSPDNSGDLEPTLISHSYLYSLSWGHKVTRVFYKSNIQYQCQEPSLHYDMVHKMDFPKSGMRTLVMGHIYWLATTVNEDKYENVELQRKEMVSGFLDYDNTEYSRILDTLGAGIYICATLHSMEMMSSGSTSSTVVIGLVHFTIVDSDSDSKIVAYSETCGA